MLQSETPAHAACTASWALQSLWASAASAVIRSGHSLDRRSTYGDGALRSIRRRLSLAASCSGRLLRERGARLPMLAGWDRGAARRRRRAGTQKEMITGVASRKKKIIPLCLTIPLCWSPIPTQESLFSRLSRKITEVGTHRIARKPAHSLQGIRQGSRICILYRFSSSPSAGLHPLLLVLDAPAPLTRPH